MLGLDPSKIGHGRQIQRDRSNLKEIKETLQLIVMHNSFLKNF